MTPELLLVMAMLREGEGLRLAPYQDTTGHWTVGYGHRLTPGEYKAPITQANAEALLAQDSAKAWRDAGKITGNDNSPERVVLTCMVYQLGFAGTRQHKKTVTHLLCQNYRAAYKEMRYSDWYKQTPERVYILTRYLNTVGRAP